MFALSFNLSTVPKFPIPPNLKRTSKEVQTPKGNHHSTKSQKDVKGEVQTPKGNHIEIVEKNTAKRTLQENQKEYKGINSSLK